ncbi:MAG: hypothetical protein ACYCOU_01235 [Sulfobacillus sp.]
MKKQPLDSEEFIEKPDPRAVIREWVPTRTHRIIVREMAAMGATLDEIVGRLQERIGGFILRSDVQRLCSHEMKSGVADANLAVARSLFTLAVRGDTKAAIFWLKSRAGWRENDPVAEQPMGARTQINVSLSGEGSARSVNLMIQAQSYVNSSIPQSQWPKEVRELVGVTEAAERPVERARVIEAPAEERTEERVEDRTDAQAERERLAEEAEAERERRIEESESRIEEAEGPPLRRVGRPKIEGTEPPGCPIDLDHILDAGLGGPMYQEGEQFWNGK